jgi:protein-tyrosine-phosphatase
MARQKYSTLSAGTDPLTVAVMAELGINIQSQGLYALSDYVGQSFDLVVTVCDQATEECPVFPGAGRQLHWSFAEQSCFGFQASILRVVPKRMIEYEEQPNTLANRVVRSGRDKRGADGNHSIQRWDPHCLLSERARSSLDLGPWNNG